MYEIENHETNHDYGKAQLIKNVILKMTLSKTITHIQRIKNILFEYLSHFGTKLEMRIN